MFNPCYWGRDLKKGKTRDCIDKDLISRSLIISHISWLMLCVVLVLVVRGLVSTYITPVPCCKKIVFLAPNVEMIQFDEFIPLYS